MVFGIRNQTHVELRGDNPLEAVVAGTHYKAYLVGNLAIKDGVQVSADHYGLDLAQVHSAIAFYYDNEDAIREALQQARQSAQDMGAMTAKEALERIRKRKTAS